VPLRTHAGCNKTPQWYLYNDYAGGKTVFWIRKISSGSVKPELKILVQEANYYLRTRLDPASTWTFLWQMKKYIFGSKSLKMININFFIINFFKSLITSKDPDLEPDP
jgi:hypothetical protein